MSTRRTALVGAALGFAAAVSGAARAAAPQPLPPPAAATRTPGGLAPPQLRAQANAPAGVPATGPKPAAPAARAPTPTPAVAPAAEDVDDELLEFLGSVGDDKDGGGDWLDFLASTDVDKVAKVGARAPVRGK